MPQAVAIQVSDVCQAFGQTNVLEQVSLAIEPGEFISLVGPSGCGKSTLLRLLAGLVRPSRGEVKVSGSNPSIAFVFQDPTLLPWRSVLENIALPLELTHIPAAQRQQRAVECLALVGLLPEDAGKYPRELSGGMRMRVSLARALVTQPDVLLLDEPFAALDDLLRQQLNEELLRLWEAQRWTAVFVTHNVAEAVYLSQRVVIMSPRPGRIDQELRSPFAYPRPSRLRAQADFASLCGQVSDELRGRRGLAAAGQRA